MLRFRTGCEPFFVVYCCILQPDSYDLRRYNLTTRKVYEITIRILGLVMLIGAITSGLYGLVTYAGSAGPSVAGFSRSVATSGLGASLVSAAMGLVLIRLAPGLARRVEPSEVQVALPAGLSAREILALAVQIFGLSMAAHALPSLVSPIIALLSRPGNLAIPGQASSLTYPLARLAIGILLIFHRRLLGNIRSTGDRIARSEKEEAEDPW